MNDPKVKLLTPEQWASIQVAPEVPTQTYDVRRVTRFERMYTPQAATVTPPKPEHDLDLIRLNDSAARLPEGLRMEFMLRVSGTPDAFYITKKAANTHWAIYAMHQDPVYGEYTGRLLPKPALKWCGCSPWATLLMVAHEVPAWCERSFPDPKRLSTATLVSDVVGLAAPTIDPILYGVMVAGSWWGFVPLAAWHL